MASTSLARRRGGDVVDEELEVALGDVVQVDSVAVVVLAVGHERVLEREDQDDRREAESQSCEDSGVETLADEGAGEFAERDGDEDQDAVVVAGDGEGDGESEAGEGKEALRLRRRGWRSASRGSKGVSRVEGRRDGLLRNSGAGGEERNATATSRNESRRFGGRREGRPGEQDPHAGGARGVAPRCPCRVREQCSGGRARWCGAG